ncbi:MAG: hypothetical protein KDB22_27675 [Planctomycetales bacterium]|nr:hypothetical protein [Planctomycetales bacterium]
MCKKLVIGVDEAGYGPNLGPLIIAASVWKVPTELSENELTTQFGRLFQAKKWARDCEHVPLGDSKILFSPGKGLATLEAGLLAVLATATSGKGSYSSTLQQLLAAVKVTIDSGSAAQPSASWYQEIDEYPVPMTAEVLADLPRLSELARTQLTSLGVELVGLRAVVITEREFNRQLARLRSKGELLSQASLQLVSDSLRDNQLAAEVFCDRQGGRKNYLPVLLAAMPEEWFVENASAPARSSYRSTSQPELTIHFSVRGDHFPPTALASMLAKYLRERLMQSVNEFWRNHLPSLKPTAGYPMDAARFRHEIEAVAKRLRLDPEDWWRTK